jgi:hypothetical protein
VDSSDSSSEAGARFLREDFDMATSAMSFALPAVRDARMTLQEFLTKNRAELIRRTCAKVASRSSPPADATELEEGVPLFLSQLSGALEQGANGDTEEMSGAAGAKGACPPPNPEIAKSAAVHGRHLLELGFSIEQVVHDYGDVCQAVTELAEERGATLSISEFHTLNRCLENAIAGAVSSWSEWREHALADEAGNAGELVTFKRDLGKLVRQATATR